LHGGDERYMHNFNWKISRKEIIERPNIRWEDNIKMILIKVGGIILAGFISG
jgi:hypothetical protein